MPARKLDDWLEDCGREHRHPVNKRQRNGGMPSMVVSLPAWPGLRH
jgi:hypothetical protein